jgi:hypothetical protein
MATQSQKPSEMPEMWSPCNHNEKEADEGGEAVMPKISSVDEYLHSEDVQDGDVLTIVQKPILVTEDESTLGHAYFKVRVKGRNIDEKTWTPNKTTLKRLASTFGDETDAWLNKKVKISKVTMEVNGETKQVLFGEPTQ